MMSPATSLRSGRLKFQLDRMLIKGTVYNTPELVNRAIAGHGYV